jgi:hypothetical protein
LLESIGITSAFDGKSGQVREVARIDSLDIGGSKQKQKAVYAYIVSRLESNEEMILGRPWFFYENAVIDFAKDELHIRRTDTRVFN